MDTRRGFMTEVEGRPSQGGGPPSFRKRTPTESLPGNYPLMIAAFLLVVFLLQWRPLF
jgi:hypothetical protein